MTLQRNQTGEDSSTRQGPGVSRPIKWVHNIQRPGHPALGCPGLVDPTPLLANLVLGWILPSCGEEAVESLGAYLPPATRGVAGAPNVIGIGTGLSILIIFVGHTGSAGYIVR